MVSEGPYGTGHGRGVTSVVGMFLICSSGDDTEVAKMNVSRTTTRQMITIVIVGPKLVPIQRLAICSWRYCRIE